MGPDSMEPVLDSGASASGYIVIVDDDAAFREAVALALRQAGYTVTSAPDHRRALEVLEGDGRIDLLVTDIVMPDRVNGLALARMARLRRKGLKVLYVTGYDLPGIEDEALGRVLRKPIEVDLLVVEIGRTLAEKA
jgi:CheY-like chemotaxis protein